MSKLKMYILVLDSIESGIAASAIAHAALGTYLAYQHDEKMEAWKNGVFYKVVCLVNKKEFERAKTFDKNAVFTESSLDGQEVAIGFCPREEWPKLFKFYRLYR